MGKNKKDDDDDELIKLAKEMGDASRKGDADALAKLADRIPKDEDGRYIVP